MANVFCFLPLLGAMAWAWLSASLPVPLALLAIILLLSLAAYIIYARTQDLLAYTSSKQVIHIDANSVSIQRSLFGLGLAKHYPAESIKAMFLLPSRLSLFSRSSQSSLDSGQSYSLGLLRNRWPLPVAVLATGLPPTNAQSFLADIYRKFPKYGHGAGFVGPA